MCDCSCHADPEIILCGKCRSQHDLDAIMAEASHVTFANDEVKRDFLRDWCGVGNA